MGSKTTLVTLGLAALAAMAGCCQPREPLNQMYMHDRMMDMVRQTTDQYMVLLMQLNEQNTGHGCVSVQPSPAGAQLFVDGAEILAEDTQALVVPLGVHEFTARWPDGVTATRRVYVPQMKATYHIDYKIDSHTGSRSGGGGISYSGRPNVQKTVIALNKPAK